MPVRPRGFSGRARRAVPLPFGGMYGFWAVAGPGVPHGDQDGWPGAKGTRCSPVAKGGRCSPAMDAASGRGAPA